jgi:cytochrome P450 family 142 subfamily A polypeptide 1
MAITTQPDTRPDVDLLDPHFWTGDFHAPLRWMRANEPVFRDERNDLWAVTMHHDIQDTEARNAIFVSGRGYRSYDAPDETNMIALDDPRHADQRRLVSRRFTPKAVRGHDEWITDATTEMTDAFIDDGTVEVIDGLAGQLPTRMTARLLGWPEDRWPDIKSWAERLMAYDQAPVDNDVAMAMITAIMEFAGDMGPMIEERRGCPMDDLMSVWANAEIDGEPLDVNTMVHEVGLFISGGAETTRTVISRGLRTFCDHNDQWELLAAHPEHIPTAVDELVRWVTPLNNFFRVAAVDTTIGGVPIAAGDRVMLVYPSGNRDETVFDDPYRFDVTRNPNPHVGFGFGTHFCLGASLARLVLTRVLEQLTTRITNLRVDAEVVDTPNMFACMVDSFQLGFDRR